MSPRCQRGPRRLSRVGNSALHFRQPVQGQTRGRLAFNISSLLDLGTDPNAQGASHGTALQAVCATWIISDKQIETRVKIVNLLIDSGADVDINIAGGYYGTALQAASMTNKSTAMVELLLKSGADVNAQGGHSGNALQAVCAARFSELDMVRLLLEHGADVNAKGGKYGTALQAACRYGRGEVVRLLLDHGANVNTEGGIYGTSLEAACAGGKIEVVHLLLERGANVRLQVDDAWHGAARSSSSSNALLELLLNHGATVNHLREQDGIYNTALNAELEQVLSLSTSSHLWWSDDYNWLSKYSDIILFLLERGADVNLAVGKYGFALQTACAIEHNPLHRETNYGTGLTKLLLEKCPDINVNAHGGMFGSALQAAAYSGQTESIMPLLDKGAHISARGGKYGSTLNAAVIRGFWGIVKILLHGGAEPDCHRLLEPDEEWLLRVREEHGRGAVERYRKFWEVEKAKGAEMASN